MVCDIMRTASDPRQCHATVLLQCFCGENPDLTANGDEADETECDYLCEGTTTDEICGGYYRMSVYSIGPAQTLSPTPTHAPYNVNTANRLGVTLAVVLSVLNTAAHVIGRMGQ